MELQPVARGPVSWHRPSVSWEFAGPWAMPQGPSVPCQSERSQRAGQRGNLPSRTPEDSKGQRGARCNLRGHVRPGLQPGGSEGRWGGRGLLEKRWTWGWGVAEVALSEIGPLLLQEWDYTYVHSFYHCALAMSFVLLLPKANKKAGSAGPPAKLDCSTLCCACI